MSELNPVVVEKTILEILNEISESPIECRDALANALAAKRAFEQAEARAYMAYEGPAHAKKYAAILATEQEAIARDAAEVAHRFIERKSRALDKKLDGFRSLGTYVRQVYENAGRGEW